MTQTVYRIGHLSINNGEGIPAGPYQADAHAEHMDDCIPFSYDYNTNTVTDEDCTPGCLVRRLNDACQAIYGTTDGFSAPTPDDEGIRFLSGYHHSGFQSTDALMAWMGRCLEELHDAGFALFVYESDNVIAGAKQVAFPGHKSTLIDILPLIDEE